MTIRVARLAAPVLLAMMAIPSAAAPSALMISDSALDLSAAVPQLPTDRPERQGAIIILVSFKRPPNLQKAAISTFIVDYPPGASAMLHRTPTSRYVLVPVLAGSQTMHHRAVVCYGDPFAGPFSPARAEAPPPASLRHDPIKPRETDGLSRNPDDCASYGCIDNGGS